MDNRFFQAENDRLIQELQIGKKEAFHEIYWLYWDKLLMYAFNVLKDKEVCEDLIQEVFMDLWIRRDRTSIRNLKAYLFNAIKFQVMKHHRSTKVTKKYLDHLQHARGVQSLEPAVQVNELRTLIDDSISRLPDRCREIFCLSRFENQSNREIAQNLGISEQAVKKQISKALRHLRSVASYVFCWVLLIPYKAIITIL